jgi:hypothetical protein
MTHHDRVTRALRFQSPDCLPLEIHDVPHLYDAYGTLDPAAVRLVPGVEDFDSLRVTYHWTFADLGRNVNGEQLRRDEWGCLHRVPADTGTAYEIMEKPLVAPAAFADYDFPDPAVSDPFFARTAATVTAHYPDRFVCGYMDPGPLLVAFNLMGYEGLLTRLYDDLDQVLAVMRGIVAYQKAIIDRWAGIGVPMVALIDEFAGTEGLMFSPDLWRRHFADFYAELFAHIQGHGMLAGCLFDGDITPILPDYLALRPDVIEIMQPNLVGVERWGQALRGKVAAKASVDMMTTLASSTPEACRAEARRLVETFHTPAGGFMGISLRWHRPQYPAANVAAVVAALNEHRC